MSTNQQSTDAVTKLSQAEQIDLICDQFEQDFRAGRGPTIERFLRDFDEPLRSELLLALVGLDIELRQKNGSIPERKEYCCRFPDHCDTITQAFIDPIHHFFVRNSAESSSNYPIDAYSNGLSLS